jgi:hypothetical protein
VLLILILLIFRIFQKEKDKYSKRMETVTVDEAIKRGKRTTTYPGLIFMFPAFAVFIYIGVEHILPFWIIPVGVVLTFVLIWLYWSIAITKWKLWAFENVRNVHELKKKAIKENLIWPNDSFCTKTEIRSAADKEKWDALQIKFKQKDIFIDDHSILTETIIYYSKKKMFVELIPVFILFITDSFFITQRNAYWLGIGSLICASVWGYLISKKFRNAIPQIIISNKGIQTVNTKFYSWAEIKNEDVVSENYGEGDIDYFLSYKHPQGREKLKINKFNTDWRSLDKLLALYRGRHRSNTH